MTRGGLRYLIDTSAAFRLFDGLGADVWAKPQRTGLIGLCDLTELEIQYSARSMADRDRVTDLIALMFPWVPMPDRVFDRAREVQGQLTGRGLHRSAGAVDLVIAATAELSELALVHQDRDFETIAQVTGQPTRWLVPAAAAPGDQDGPGSAS